MRHDSSSKNFDLIADALGSSDVEDRRQASVELLAHLEATAALPLLLRALGDDDWRVRKEATQAARAFGGDRALVQALVKVIGRDDDARDQLDNVGLRNAAVDVLAAAGPAATPVLAVALGGLDADGRKLAIEALGRSRDPAAVDPLVVRARRRRREREARRARGARDARPRGARAHRRRRAPRRAR